MGLQPPLPGRVPRGLQGLEPPARWRSTSPPSPPATGVREGLRRVGGRSIGRSREVRRTRSDPPGTRRRVAQRVGMAVKGQGGDARGSLSAWRTSHGRFALPPPPLADLASDVASRRAPLQVLHRRGASFVRSIATRMIIAQAAGLARPGRQRVVWVAWAVDAERVGKERRRRSDLVALRHRSSRRRRCLLSSKARQRSASVRPLAPLHCRRFSSLPSCLSFPSLPSARDAAEERPGAATPRRAVCLSVSFFSSSSSRFFSFGSTSRLGKTRCSRARQAQRDRFVVSQSAAGFA